MVDVTRWLIESNRLFNIETTIMYPGVTNSMPSPHDPSGWSVGSNVTITNVEQVNPSGVGFTGEVEQVNTGTAIFSESGEVNTLSTETLYMMCIVKPDSFDMDLSFFFSDKTLAPTVRIVVNVSDGVIKSSSGAWDGELFRQELSDGYFLMGVSHSPDVNWSRAFGNFRLRDESLGIPPIGSKVFMQAAFFGISDDFPALVQPVQVC